MSYHQHPGPIPQRIFLAKNDMEYVLLSCLYSNKSHKPLLLAVAMQVQGKEVAITVIYDLQITSCSVIDRRRKQGSFYIERI